MGTVYRPEIDGLRAIAVVSVVLFHAGLATFSGGFAGVDVFFVISGYLISKILFAEMKNGQFTVARFYVRRAKRILPALFVAVLICVPFAWLWLLPAEYVEFSSSISALSVFGSNIFFWTQTGYFDGAVELKPLIHTWTLSVEEQFYVFFPLLLIALSRWSRKACGVVLLSATVASFILAQWASANYTSANFFLLPTRAWELGVGTVIGAFKLDQIKRFSDLAAEILSVIGLSLILFSFFAYDALTPFPSVYTLAPVIGTALIIVFTSQNRGVGKLLRNKLLVAIGLISYSLYIWHQPILAFARVRFGEDITVVPLLLCLLLSVWLSAASYYLVENPIRRVRASSSSVLGSAAFCSVMMLALGIGGAMYASSTSLARSFNDALSMKFDSGKLCEPILGVPGACSTSVHPEIAIWGDSYAAQLLPAISNAAEDVGIARLTRNGCGPLSGVSAEPRANGHTRAWAKSCIHFNDSVREWLANARTVQYVVISASFKHYFSGLYDGQKTVPYINGELTTRIEKEINFVESLGMKAVVVSPTAQNGKNLGLCAARARWFNRPMNACSFRYEDQTPEAKGVLNELRGLSEAKNVVFLPQASCDKGKCDTVIDGQIIYHDESHLTAAGARIVGQKLGLHKRFNADTSATEVD